MDKATRGKIAGLSYHNGVDWVNKSPDEYIDAVKEAIERISQISGEDFDKVLEKCFDSIYTLNAIEKEVIFYGFWPTSLDGPKCQY